MTPSADGTPWARRAVASLGAAALVAAGLAAVGTFAAAEAQANPTYDVTYDARLDPATRSFAVAVRVRQGAGELRSLAFRADPARQTDWRGDGTVEVREDGVTWEVPEAGGTLRYVFLIDQLRDDKSYDARCAAQWAVFRGDDLVPPAAARMEKGAQSRARLRLRLPEGWSSVTRFPRDGDGYRVENPERSFVRPTGWMAVARRMGVVRESVAGVRVAIAGPAGQDVHRLDMLALLRWTLPGLAKVLPAMPERLLVVSAGDPMWRGGLSGPSSLFVHADRPLIASDGTSPLLHEMLHTALPEGASADDDWLVEGLAEYYSIALLARSRTISKVRHEKILRGLSDRGQGVGRVRGRTSEGDITARAVTLLAELDARIVEASEDTADLDAVVRFIASNDMPLAFQTLREAVEKVVDKDLEDFFDRPIFRQP